MTTSHANITKTPLHFVQKNKCSPVFKTICWPKTPSFCFQVDALSSSLLIRPTKFNSKRGGEVKERQWSSTGTRRRRSNYKSNRSAMPCSSASTVSGGVGGGGGRDDNGSLRYFKLNESTFLASLMPKKEIGADRFIDAHPEFGGRGVVIAIFDSGVDPAAAGLQLTSDGKPKILDVIDCTGSGDIDTSKVVKADADCCIRGASGAALAVNSSWKNPSGEWHVGYKLVYEPFTATLTARLKVALLSSLLCAMQTKERKKKWDEKNQEEIAVAVKHLDEFNQVFGNPA
ncbi:tripeptidyl-peptidase 2-like [Jatropha curcas]|uniref:tripeptidyl-peptidase 2-like n=1 Tax=Jatropha curcas TaxID=180498 RepID=UPI001895C7CC|nr:tripeptidyl-peptidase 2-like [Jatropha curcas]